MDSFNPSHLPPVAIVGIGAQLPSGYQSTTNLDYHAFIDFLLNKGEAYESIPHDRFNIEHIRGRAIGQIAPGAGAFLKGLDLMDHMEFGISAKDARYMPISVRKLIEVTFLALYDAGVNYRGHNVGCYMSGTAYDIFGVSGQEEAEATGSLALPPSMLANRVSYHLDLRGPSIPVDTACSSSLTATHIAVQALKNGECDTAVVGGAQINNRFIDWLLYTQGGILSPDGKCKPFDVSADGFGRGEGVVVMVLKPLDAAIRDHDHIYGTILGTGVNSGGSQAPPNAPVAAAQRDAMLRAFRQTEKKPQDVDFLELHSTGTALGDPTEANWVGAEFGRDGELTVGSVKGNIGHLETAAFLASLCKICGMFESGLIPPNANFKTPNPAVQWSKYRLRVPVEPVPLAARSTDGHSLVAMTSLGIGGANGHCIVQSPPDTQASPSSFWTKNAQVPSLIVAAGMSPRSVGAIEEALSALDVSLHERNAIANIYGRRARSLTWRSFAVADPKSTKLASFSRAAMSPKTKPPMVFVFSGQGTQHFQMGRELFKSCAPFRATILELDAVYASVVGSSLIASTGLFTDALDVPKDTLDDPWPIAIVLPALTILQLALVDALKAVGVSPDIVIGHSAGETAVLAASGASCKALAVELAIARGRALTIAEGASISGTMAAVSCSPEDARRLIEEVKAELGGDGVLDIGCYNAANAITLSGAESFIDVAVAKAAAAGVFARKLKTRSAVHSALMDLCKAEFETLVGEVFARYPLSAPEVETYSTLTGKQLDVALDAKYYWNGTRSPVLFDAAMEAIFSKHAAPTFVEIGPHPVLSAYIQSVAGSGEGMTITCPLRRSRSTNASADSLEFLTALGKVVVAGHTCVDFDALYGSPSRDVRTLPPYPFAPKTIPWSIPTPEVARQRQHRNGPLNYPQLKMNVRTHPELADHVIKGEPIMPGAGFVEMALEFGASAVFDVKFHNLLTLSAEHPIPVQVELDGTQWSVRSATSTDYTAAWPIKYDRLHASGFLSMEPAPEDHLSPLDIEATRRRMKPMNMDGFYEQIRSFAQFGPMYRRIRQCHVVNGEHGAVEVLTEVDASGDDIPNFTGYRLAPPILDAVFHVLVHPRLTGNYDPNLYHLPSRLSSMRLCRALEGKSIPSRLFSHAIFVNWTPETITYSFTVTDESGTALLIVDNLEVSLHGYRMQAIENRYDVVYHPTELSLASHIGASSVADSLGPTAQVAKAQTSNGDSTPAHIIPYVRGEEMKIQHQIAQHDALQPRSLLFIAEDGLNGDASQGFTRSLRKECPMWTIRVASFDSSWSEKQRVAAAKELLLQPTEDVEMRVDAAGNILVPRIETISPPTALVAFDSAKPWTIQDGKLSHISLQQPSTDHVVVRVNRVQGPRQSNLWAYVGEIDGVSRPVVGISAGPVASHLIVHRGSVAECDWGTRSGTDSAGAAPPVLAAAVVALAVGVACAKPERLRGKRVLLLESDDVFRSQLEDVCATMGMDVVSTSALSAISLQSCYRSKPAFILSGTQDSDVVKVLKSLLAPHGRTFLWNYSDGLANEPWALGDALQNAIHHVRSHPAIKYTPLSDLLQGISSSAASSNNLFDTSKSYLLIGGLGSLGLHVALWMYEKGARDIVLTSRSGVESLQRRGGDFIALRILHYLEQRADLSIKTAAVDAASADGMAALVRGITRPLGGCFLLSAVLSDGMFQSHTAETFERAFTPKVQAFHALQRAVDLESLDFFVTFSSVSGLFGNAGQTSYSAANAALAGLTRKYKNAFSIVPPIILDTSILTMSEDGYNTRVRHMVSWGMTAREVCDYVGDGIMKLREGATVWQYIPDLDWRAVRFADDGRSHQVYGHLVPTEAQEAVALGGDKKVSLSQIVCQVLDLKVDDVSIDVPLTSYGLDSLYAAALSFALRPILTISQIQLLADVTIKDLQAKVEAADAVEGEA
ncbi:hypothetical protein C8Q80DRAFT_1222755 [Daedaleopsis nitida]|nr:hypothetical protein C8Q80DRAFT_1222755 [Daedaleopsis nitida]